MDATTKTLDNIFTPEVNDTTTKEQGELTEDDAIDCKNKMPENLKLNSNVKIVANIAGQCLYEDSGTGVKYGDKPETIDVTKPVVEASVPIAKGEPVVESSVPVVKPVEKPVVKGVEKPVETKNKGKRSRKNQPIINVNVNTNQSNVQETSDGKAEIKPIEVKPQGTKPAVPLANKPEEAKPVVPLSDKPEEAKPAIAESKSVVPQSDGPKRGISLGDITSKLGNLKPVKNKDVSSENKDVSSENKDFVDAKSKLKPVTKEEKK
jgi:hypothetical protein